MARKKTQMSKNVRVDPMLALKREAKSKVIAPTKPKDSVILDEHDQKFYRAEMRQRLHREMRRVFKRQKEIEGLSYADLAERLGVNRSVITRRFKGTSNLTLDIISDMFRAMGSRLNIEAKILNESAVVTEVIIANIENVYNNWCSDIFVTGRGFSIEEAKGLRGYNVVGRSAA